MLILKRMNQLVRHDRFLPIDVDPIGEMKLLRLWIVVAGHLLRQQTNDQRPVLKIRGRQAELLQSHFGGVHLFRLRVAIQVAQNHLFDLRAGLRRTLHRPQNRRAPESRSFLSRPLRSQPLTPRFGRP